LCPFPNAYNYPNPQEYTFLLEVLNNVCNAPHEISTTLSFIEIECNYLVWFYNPDNL